MATDPIVRELIYKGLVTVADNMILTVVRTSRSTVVKNNLDFSASVCDGEGRLAAQGLALPVHLGATMPALKGCLDYYGEDVHPGDIFANNDPYSGASHLNDIFMFRPVFKDGERIAFLSIILHHTDMGGRVPGGNAPDSTEIFQEGLRIPPTKIVEGGKPNTTLLRLIETNVRVPDKVLGDVRSQIAALEVGERQLLKQVEAWSADELRAALADQIDYAERLTRAGIEALPDGTVEFTDWNDDDGAGGGPVRIHVRLSVAGDEVEVDFTGTSPQTSGALNPNYWFTVSCAYAAIRSALDPEIPNNSGFYRPIRVIAPEGSFVNPRFPAPVGARGQSGYRCRTAVLGALAKLMPGQVPACPGGSEFGIVFAGNDSDGARFLFLEFHNVTGHGGGPDRDGQEPARSPSGLRPTCRSKSSRPRTRSSSRRTDSFPTRAARESIAAPSGWSGNTGCWPAKRWCRSARIGNSIDPGACSGARGEGLDGASSTPAPAPSACPRSSSVRSPPGRCSEAKCRVRAGTETRSSAIRRASSRTCDRRR